MPNIGHVNRPPLSKDSCRRRVRSACTRRIYENSKDEAVTTRGNGVLENPSVENQSKLKLK
mgnify:CR=1 FL=1